MGGRGFGGHEGGRGFNPEGGRGRGFDGPNDGDDGFHGAEGGPGLGPPDGGRGFGGGGGVGRGFGPGFGGQVSGQSFFLQWCK